MFKLQITKVILLVVSQKVRNKVTTTLVYVFLYLETHARIKPKYYENPSHKSVSQLRRIIFVCVLLVINSKAEASLRNNKSSA